MEHIISEKPLPNEFGVPLRFIEIITTDSPVNPDMWKITGLDSSDPQPPDHADFSHGLVTIDDTKRGVCILLNTDDGNDEGTYFNLIGGEIEKNESPELTFRREMLEETGITPDTNKLQYLGLIVSDDIPSTPLFGYHIERNELKSIKPIIGSKELALVPITTLKEALPNLS